VPICFFSFFLSSFHSLIAVPSCPPLCHASPPRYVSPLSRRAFVMRRSCRVVPSSRIAPVVSRCAFATRRTFATPRLATSRRLVQTCGGKEESVSGGWAGWNVSEGKQVQVV
jgi:hypothetical protein